MSCELEAELVAAYHTRLATAETPLELTERLLMVRDRLHAHPPPAGAGGHLLVMHSGTPPFWFSLAGASRLGRSDDTDLPLPCPSVSRCHCRIDFDGSDWQLHDLQSQNGVRVNGQPVTSHLLRQGDLIQLGRVSLIFVYTAEATANGEEV